MQIERHNGTKEATKNITLRHGKVGGRDGKVGGREKN